MIRAYAQLLENLILKELHKNTTDDTAVNAPFVVSPEWKKLVDQQVLLLKASNEVPHTNATHQHPKKRFTHTHVPKVTKTKITKRSGRRHA